ncbi:RAMP superfamily CRISPR-associated protein [Vandammella animalimorsus]|uniref:CRISPR type III-associated protein domain-containing protein n=1 Tax=Vandammella animalimorsus TaxID=2029117 RepID=A0A2A2AXR2_9BURK|nr:RAMP superfamily CRISPR-associated protein [Vandammella animalimorsus]PAT42636.1 hypothetical protein CK621_08135 [Vandammella animalimorsus]
MRIHNYRLTFLTPAFLGNAQQQGQWRTPPIKALLRQYWRMAVADRLKFDVAALRTEEAKLFGAAADNDGDFGRSRVRLRLSHWGEGKLTAWPGMTQTRHPEVPRPVGSDLYMGFGPLVFNRGSALKQPPAIAAGEQATLSLAHAEDKQSKTEIATALYLMHLYGTLGGRSRNGWGSFFLQAEEGTAPPTGKVPTRAWSEALQMDWPHAIGQDGKGALIWQTQAFDDWPALMTELAKLKIALRTQFKFTTGKDAPHPEKRHWLSYPVTNHSVKAWGGNARLPNSLRFKVRPAPNDSCKLVGVIFHMPCLPPAAFQPNSDLQAITAVWQDVHHFLDDQATLTRILA